MISITLPVCNSGGADVFRNKSRKVEPVLIMHDDYGPYKYKGFNDK
jgi:hypothetical protein